MSNLKGNLGDNSTCNGINKLKFLEINLTKEAKTYTLKITKL